MKYLKILPVKMVTNPFSSLETILHLGHPISSLWGNAKREHLRNYHFSSFRDTIILLWMYIFNSESYTCIKRVRGIFYWNALLEKVVLLHVLHKEYVISVNILVFRYLYIPVNFTTTEDFLQDRRYSATIHSIEFFWDGYAVVNMLLCNVFFIFSGISQKIHSCFTQWLCSPVEGMSKGGAMFSMCNDCFCFLLCELSFCNSLTLVKAKQYL